MTDEEFIRNLPEHHMPSWIASYNSNKTAEEAKVAEAAANATKIETDKKAEDKENAAITSGTEGEKSEATKVEAKEGDAKTEAKPEVKAPAKE